LTRSLALNNPNKNLGRHTLAPLPSPPPAPRASGVASVGALSSPRSRHRLPASRAPGVGGRWSLPSPPSCLPRPGRRGSSVTARVSSPHSRRRCPSSSECIAFLAAAGRRTLVVDHHAEPPLCRCCPMSPSPSLPCSRRPPPGETSSSSRSLAM
jgi:hypothetical protein